VNLASPHKSAPGVLQGEGALLYAGKNPILVARMSRATVSVKQIFLLYET
jgi:hypothetical protein